MKTHYTTAGSLLFLLFCFLIKTSSSAQAPAGEPALLFQSQDLLPLTLTMNFMEALRDVGDETSQHQGTISYTGSDGKPIILPVRIKTRGHFRRNPMNCNFPPLRLNFTSEEVVNTLFEGQDKLKLVTHCRSRNDRYEQYVLKEYLVYRLYNLFTEYSYRVRLVKMSYVDSIATTDTLVKMGFLIEPTEQMVSRNACNQIEIKNIRQGDCDPGSTTLVSVFQYMIGNTDWSIPALHNIVLVQEHTGDPPVPIPYDFDWSGLVDAAYAVPAEILGIDDVKTRLYRGLCRSEEDYEQAIEEFRVRENEIFDAIRTVPCLKEKEKGKIVRYVEQFFNTVDNPRKIKSEITSACRTK
jgi:hypothetical protein